MSQDFESEWRRARILENGGNAAAAKEIYTVLLEQDPHRLYVRIRMCELERGAGRYRISREHALKAATTVRRGRWKDLAAVTRLLLKFDEHEVVFDLIDAADWRDEQVLDSAPRLAQYLWLTGHVPDALRLIAVASDRRQSDPLLSYAKANALRYSGQMAEATTEYERCIGLAPNFAHAHWSLANHEMAATPGGRIARIVKAQAAFAVDAKEQAYLRYALFKEYDRAADTERAWASLRAGIHIKRRTIQYDSMREHEGFAALRELASFDFVGEPVKEPSPGPLSPIFIVGMPRTGTTLLERILGSHSQVSAAGELNDFSCALSWESDQFLGPMVTPESIERMRDIDFSRVGQIYLQRILGRAKGRPRLVDKNPMNFVNVGFICKALPRAKILCMNRTPMDACFSNLKQLFSGDAYGYSYDLTELAQYYFRFRQLLKHWQEAAPEQFHVVDYERLVEGPMETTEQLMRFCGLPFEPECVDITRNRAPVSTASSSQVREPINARGVGAWRKYAPYLESLRAEIEGTFPSVS
jgi:tetratricopeptide (TPR) repeat protein